MKNQRYIFFGSYEMGIAIIGGLTIAFAIVLVMKMLSPTICTLAVSKLQSEFVYICNEEVLNYINSKNISYENIVHIQRDEKGEISAMTTDMVAVNKMKSEIAINVQRRLDEREVVYVDFPTGGLFGIGEGIEIPVNLIFTSDLEIDLKTDFSSSGINQTNLNITMDLEAYGELLLIGEESKVNVKTQIPVAQTIIVGDVPSTYLNVKK